MLSHVSREGFCAAGFLIQNGISFVTVSDYLYYILFSWRIPQEKVEYEVKYHVNFYGAENVDKYKKSKSSEETLEKLRAFINEKAAS